MRQMVKTEMFIDQSNANLDLKMFIGKISHLLGPEIRKNAGKECVWETRFPCSYLVHDLPAIHIWSMIQSLFLKLTIM